MKLTKQQFDLRMAQFSCELESLGHPDLATMLDTQPIRIGARGRRLFIAAYTLNKEDLLKIEDPLDLVKQAVGDEISIEDRIRRKYWKHFPPELMKARRLKRPKRGKHKFGGLFITRAEMYELYDTARSTIKAMKVFLAQQKTDAEPSSRWKLIFEKWNPPKNLTPEEAKAQLVQKVRQDLQTFETFFLKLRTMWGKRGIETYLVYWS